MKNRGAVQWAQALIIIALSQPCVKSQAGPTGPKLVYATYAGMGTRSMSRALAVDHAGFAYVGGSSLVSGSNPPLSCAFLTKLAQDGASAVWTVCLPLAQVDAVEVDEAGFLYVAGQNAPVSESHTATVLKLTPDAQTAVFATEIAGLLNGTVELAVDKAGAMYITGSAGPTFVTTPGAYSRDTTKKTFAVKLNSDGTEHYSTYLDFFTISTVAVDRLGNAWMAGTACGDVTCRTAKFGTRAYIAQLDSAGTSILSQRAFGGGTNVDTGAGIRDSANGLAVGRDGVVWVVGGVQSKAPTTPDAIQPQRPSGTAVVGYALRLSAGGELLYGTYVGGFAQVSTGSVALDHGGNPFVVLAVSALSSSVLSLAADGSSIRYSQQFGAWVQSIALDGHGGLYVSGTSLPSLPTCPVTPGAYQSTAAPLNTRVCVGRFDLRQTLGPEAFFPLNAASLRGGSAAPGEFVTFYGLNLPEAPSVNFDGQPAPILFSDGNKIGAVVPFGISGSHTEVDIQGVGRYRVRVGATAPALFTSGGSGTGQLDARNADGSANGSNAPASGGDVVRVFMTGAGLMNPALSDGALGPSDPPFPAPLLPVFVTINGVGAKVVGAMQVPGKIAGIVQVDFQLPADTVAGDAIVKISSDPLDFPFQPRTTIAVQ